jgi:parallel beta-helix repeat protein
MFKAGYAPFTIMEQAGISVDGNATPTLLENTCERNGLHGISYSGCSGGIAEENDCRDNFTGISLCINAAPKLLRNADT